MVNGELEGMAPAVDRGRAGDRRARAAQGQLVDTGRIECGLADAEKTLPPPLPVGDQPDGVAAKAAKMRIGDGERAGDGDRRLDGVATLADDGDARFAGQPMGTGDHAARAGGGRGARVHDSTQDGEETR